MSQPTMISLEMRKDMLRKLHNYIVMENHELQEHQLDAIKQIKKFLEIPNGQEIEAYPPEAQNSGRKKGDFCELVCADNLESNKIFGTLARVIDMPTIIVTSRDINNKAELDNFIADTGLDQKDIAIYNVKNSKEIPNAKVIITNSFSVFSDNKNIPNLIILDNPKKVKKNAKIIENMFGKSVIATFNKTSSFIGKNLFKGQGEIYNLGVINAIKKGLLCNGIKTGRIEVGSESNDNYYPESSVIKPDIIDAAIQFHLRHKYSDLGALNKFPSVFLVSEAKYAEEGVEKYNSIAAKIRINSKAAFIASKMPDKERNKIIEDYNSGEIQTLFTDKVLEINAPDATICYSLKPAKSQASAETQLAMVTGKNGKNKIALAVNIYPQGSKPILFGDIIGNKVENGLGNYVETGSLFAKILEKPNLLEKSDEFFGINDMARATKKSPLIITEIYKKLESEWQSSQGKSFIIYGIKVEANEVGNFMCNGKVLFCVAKSLAENLKSIEINSGVFAALKSMVSTSQIS